MHKILLLTAILATHSWAATAQDQRQPLLLSPPQRAHLLAEMRRLLTGTQQLVGALANDDLTAAAQHAQALGMAMTGSAENHLGQVLPPAFMQLGISLHQDFDVLAADIKTQKNAKHSLRQLAAALTKCYSCHAAYQLSDADSPGHEARLAEIAERGRHVMPFALEQTRHIFTNTPQGGVQQVVVTDKSNTAQIALIQAHLSKIADEFSRGDFSNPAKIHGDTMPGLAALRAAKPSQLNVHYQTLADGGQITYRSDQTELVTAIHQWFAAQLSDHGRHAQAGHAHAQHLHP